ncbi:cilia- and flagella-associated protein 69 [Pelodytes ibericus]
MPAVQAPLPVPAANMTLTAGDGKKSPRPVVRLVVTDTELGDQEVLSFKSMDLERVLKLLEDPLSRDLSERHVRVLKKLSRHYCKGIPLKELSQMLKILNSCAEKAEAHKEYIDPLCEIIKLFGLPFLKEKTSDEINYANVVANSVSHLGCLLRLPSTPVRIQICNAIANFYNPEPVKQQIEGFQPTNVNFKIQMAEGGDLAASLASSLSLVENQLQEKISLLKVLQLLSRTTENCKLMTEAHAGSRICSRLNDPDPSGQLLFRSSETLLNLLENGPKEEVINQLGNLECIYALKDSITRVLTNGYRHYDRQLRNDLLVIITLIAENTGLPMFQSGFAKQLILFATFSEVKSHNPLVKSLKLLHSQEDCEMKKLLFNILVGLAKDVATIQLLSDGKVVLALFNYMKANEMPGIHDWPPALFKDLQLHAIATLTTIAPLLLEDYMTCQGNTRILLFLEWCVCQEPLDGHGSCFHGTGGRCNKHALMRYSLRLLRSVVAVWDETVNQDLCDQGAISQLLGLMKIVLNHKQWTEDRILLEIQVDLLYILSTVCEHDLNKKALFGSEGVDLLLQLLRMDPSKFYSGLGYNKLLFCTLDSIWCCVLGHLSSEDYFLEKEGMIILLDLLALNVKSMVNIVLGLLVDFCDNPRSIPHITTWRGKDNELAAKLLLQLWKEEEEELGVKRDEYGRIIDTEKPLVGQFQAAQEIMPMPDTCCSIAVIEVAENTRAKIYFIFTKLGFDNFPGLSPLDYVTLGIISKYLDLKVGEVWSEFTAELRAENFKPVTSDQEVLDVIAKATENISKKIVFYQTQMIENHQHLERLEEQHQYAEIKATQKQSHFVRKSWDDFLERTSNYEALKKAKRLQEKSIDSSRPKATANNVISHSTQIPRLNATVPCGRVVTVESTPSHLIGGPLADTVLGQKRAAIRGGPLQKTISVKMFNQHSTD